MRVDLKGVHRVQAKGHTYYYAWRGGPRISALPGTPGFVQEYHEAHAARRKPATNDLAALIAEFKGSSAFPASAASQKEYRRYLDLIGERFGTMPLKAVEDLRARGVFLKWRDEMNATPRKADYAWSVLARLLSFGKDRGRIAVNVCEGGGRLYKARRQERIWTEAHIERFRAVASPELQLALDLALWTGQRQGDLLRLRWADYKDCQLQVFQSKGRKAVTIPVEKTLAEILSRAPKRAATILTGQRGGPWTGDGFRTEWGKACERAGIDDVTFHDLRGTAVTRLAQAGCTVAEIASLTGHSLQHAQAILDAHYLGGRLELARGAMAKREEREGNARL